MERNKWLTARAKGSHTVEAALIMPMVIGIILFVFYLCIYAYDRVVIHYAVISVLYEDTYRPEDNMEEIMPQEIRDKISSNSIYDWDIQVDVTSNLYDTEVELVGRMPVTNGLLNRLTDTELFSVQVKYTRRR